MSNTNKYIIRIERKEDYRIVENLVRESFWNVYRPGKDSVKTEPLHVLVSLS